MNKFQEMIEEYSRRLDKYEAIQKEINGPLMDIIISTKVSAPDAFTGNTNRPIEEVIARSVSMSLLYHFYEIALKSKGENEEVDVSRLFDAVNLTDGDKSALDRLSEFVHNTYFDESDVMSMDVIEALYNLGYFKMPDLDRISPLKFFDNRGYHLAGGDVRRVIKSFLENRFGTPIIQEASNIIKLQEFIDQVLLVKKVNSMSHEDLEKYYNKLNKIGEKTEEEIELEKSIDALKESIEFINAVSLDEHPEILEGNTRYQDLMRKKEDIERRKAASKVTLTDDQLRENIIKKIDADAQVTYNYLIYQMQVPNEPTYESNMRIVGAKHNVEGSKKNIREYIELLNELNKLAPVIEKIDKAKKGINKQIKEEQEKVDINQLKEEVRQLKNRKADIITSHSFGKNKKIEEVEKEIDDKEKAISDYETNISRLNTKRNNILVGLLTDDEKALFEPIEEYITNNETRYKYSIEDDYKDAFRRLMTIANLKNSNGVVFDDVNAALDSTRAGFNDMIQKEKEKLRTNQEFVNNELTSRELDKDTPIGDLITAKKIIPYNNRVSEFTKETVKYIVQNDTGFANVDNVGNVVINDEMSDERFNELVEEATSGDSPKTR